jgi:glycosyltransferase involved in cell wall biosynthesis
MQYPKISIITPSFNQAAFIENTINSVLSQNYPKIEYIVLDGGSTDGTIDILHRYDSKIRWISEKDLGQSNALNKGFRMASGDIFAYLNSDDTYEPGALLKVGEFFKEHAEAHWVTGKCKIIDKEGFEIRKFVSAYKNMWLNIHSYNALLVLDYISQPSTFWSREIVNKVGLYDESLYYTMDYDYSLRIGKLFKLNLINDYLANFRIHPAAKSGNIRDHFNADYLTSSKYMNSKFLKVLHKLHNELIIRAYGFL